MHVAGGHGEPDHAGGWLRGGCGQAVQAVGWRHLFKGIPCYKCSCPFTCWPRSEFKAWCYSQASVPCPGALRTVPPVLERELASPGVPSSRMGVSLPRSTTWRILGPAAGAELSSAPHWKGGMCTFYPCEVRLCISRGKSSFTVQRSVRPRLQQVG